MRVVHVDLADAAPVPRDELLDRWWTTTRLAETLAERGIDVVFVGRTSAEPFTLSRHGITYRFVHDRTRGARHVVRAVAAARPDVVHVHGLVFAAATLALRVRLPRTTLVVQHHGERPPERRHHRALQRLAARAVDAQLFTGGAVNATGFALAAVHDVLEASSDLTPRPRAAARARTGIDGEPAVVWVGRIIDGKDPATACAAFGAFAASRPDAQLWLLCTEPAAAATTAALVALAGDAAARVHVRGPVPHDDVADWFAAADVALSTSRREGSGYAVLEALACGCPVAATDLAPHRSILGPDADVFAPGDIAGAADALGRALTRPRPGVREDFLTRAGWPAVGAQLAAAYDSARAPRVARRRRI